MRFTRALLALIALFSMLSPAFFSCKADVIPGEAINTGDEDRFGSEGVEKAYTVTFDTNGGAWTGGETGVRKLEEGERLVLPRAPVMDGFTMAGWYEKPLPPLDWNEDMDAQYRFNPGKAISADVTVYARWKVKPVDSYTVTFMQYEGGDIVYTGFVYVQDYYKWTGPLPQAGKRTGFIADGYWWTDPREGEPFTAGRVVMEDTTVYARWSPESYRLYYWVNDDVNSIYSTNIVTYPVGEVILPIRPSRPGYAFIGWYTQKLNDLRHDLQYNDAPPLEHNFNPQSAVSGDTHLYALWKVVPPGSHIVTFKHYENYVTEEAALFTDSYTIDGERIPAVENRPHYTCDGKWYLANGDEFGPDTLVDADITVSPRWLGNTYTVRFMRDDGTNAVWQTASVQYPQNVLGSLPAMPERPHYSSNGKWYRGGGEEFTGSTVITGDSEVYPRWTGNLYTARFWSNGDTNELLYTETVHYPAGVSFKGPLPEKAHYATDGVWWNAPLGGNPVTAGTVISADADYYLRWTKKIYTITFNTNGAGGGNTTFNARYDEWVSPPGYPARQDYVFAGWNYLPKGDGRFFAGAYPAGDMTLYAAWVAAGSASSILDSFDKGLAATNTQMTQGGEYDDHFLVGNGAYSGPPSGAAVASALGEKLAEAARLRQGTQKTGWADVEGGKQSISWIEYDYAAINMVYQDIQDLLADPSFARGSFAPVEHTLNYTGGAQSVTVVNSGYYEVELWGASGGHIWSKNNKTALGGKGAYIKGRVYFNKGDVLKFYIGQEGYGTAAYNTATGAFSKITDFKAEGGVSYSGGHKGGWNGGGAGGSTYDSGYAGGSGGGGATDARFAGTYQAGVNNKERGAAGLSERRMVAGGGGGAAQSAGVGSDNWPGLSGGNAGENGIRKDNINTGGARAGGLAALSPASFGDGSATSGSGLGTGGKGANGSSIAYEGTGGGGGGYYGGESISVLKGTAYTSSGAGGSSWSAGSGESRGLNEALGNGKAVIRFAGN